ncbi:hypothetical protein Hanom_Chr00s103108g01804641 [Helianthus anomalus]
MKEKEKNRRSDRLSGGPINYPVGSLSGRFVYPQISRLRFGSGLGYGVSVSSHSCGSGSGWSPARRGGDDGFPTGHVAVVDICVWLGSVTNSTCYSFQISVRVFGLDSGGRSFKLFPDLIQTSIQNFSARVSSFGSTVLVLSSGQLGQPGQLRESTQSTQLTRSNQSTVLAFRH